MIKPLLIFSLSTTIAFANSGTDLLLKQKNTLNLKTNYSKVKAAINLDDTFLVQVYGAMRALRVSNINIQDYFDAIFAKDFKLALNLYSNLEPVGQGEKRLLSSSKLYLMWKLKLNQNFFNGWLAEASEYDFLNTELGVALDQIVSKDASNWLLKNAIYISAAQITQIDSISKTDSKFNYSVQAFRNLRKGAKGLEWVQFLKPNDPLRELLAKSAVLDFSRKGQLGDAAKIVKEVLEPILVNESNKEKISEYYLLLGRLLYQAGAYEASERYYRLIPDESIQFLQARVEKLWISLRENDHSVLLGDLKTLELNMFKDKFLPEVFLVSSMANLQLCQFSNVEKSFKEFVSINKKFAKEIASNLISESPKQLDARNLFVNHLKQSIILQEKEIKRIKSLIGDQEIAQKFEENLLRDFSEIQNTINGEIKNEWKNRQRILEGALRRMRFVKIEFLSKMRRLKALAQLKSGTDVVSTLTSSIDKTDKLEFPHDGILFGDELFHFTSRIRNLCLQGRKNDK